MYEHTLFDKHAYDMLNERKLCDRKNYAVGVHLYIKNRIDVNINIY